MQRLTGGSRRTWVTRAHRRKQEQTCRLPGQQCGKYPGAQLVQGALGPAVFELVGEGGDASVRGHHIRRAKVAAGQRGGPGGFMPDLDPGVLAGVLLPPLRRGWIGGQHRPAGRGPQLTGGHARRPADHSGLYRRRVGVIEPAHLIGDHIGLAAVDGAGRERGAGERQPVQRDGEAQQAARGVGCQRERRRKLIRDVFGQMQVCSCRHLRHSAPV
jgi:hypothetical protein